MKNQDIPKSNGRIDMAGLAYGKIPPQALDLESAVLGAIMLEKNAFSEVGHLLQPQSFYSERNQLIYEVIQEMDRKMLDIDILTVTQELIKKNWLEKVGGPAYVTKLTNAVVSSANIVSHAWIILRTWTQRELIKVGSEILSRSFDPSIDPLETMDDSEETMQNVRNTLDGNKTTNYTDLVFKRMDVILNNDGTKPPGIISGFPSLDKIIQAFLVQLYVIAARPSMGKTAFLVQLVENITKGTRYSPPETAGFLELETTDESYIDRHLANKSGLDSNLLKAGGLDNAEQERLKAGAQEILNQNIVADFIPEINVSLIRSKARLWKKKYGIKILIIDYLQIISPNEKDERKTREQQVASIVQGLAALVKELQIPIIAFAQLSRQLLARADKRPGMQDLRESGAIEQAARVVMFIHRPEYYGDATDAFGKPLPPGTTEIIVDKNNEGKKGTANLIMQPHLSKFIDSFEIEGPGWSAIDTELF